MVTKSGVLHARTARVGARLIATATLLVGLLFSLEPLSTGQASAATDLSISVDGNHFVNQDGQTVRLLGVDVPGTEFACQEGWGYSQVTGGNTDPASIQSTETATATAIAGWHANAVRVPLNEDCWLGLNGQPSFDASAGAAGYQQYIENWVNTLNAAGLYVILDLHWTAPGANVADGQRPMPDDHSAAFWTSVATDFESNHAVVFDAFNEPYSPAFNFASTSTLGVSWSCWLNGGCPVPVAADGQPIDDSNTYEAVGMQTLVNSIRATGATQPIMLGGLDFSNDLTQWLANEPTDPDGQLVASYHNYFGTTCDDLSCWSTTIASVASQVPVVTGEFDQGYDCQQGPTSPADWVNFDNDYMSWADDNGVSYLGWGYYQPQPDPTTQTCQGLGTAAPTTYVLIDGSGDAVAPDGADLQAHLDSLAASTAATTTTVAPTTTSPPTTAKATTTTAPPTTAKPTTTTTKPTTTTTVKPTTTTTKPKTTTTVKPTTTTTKPKTTTTVKPTTTTTKPKTTTTVKATTTTVKPTTTTTKPTTTTTKPTTTTTKPATTTTTAKPTTTTTTTTKPATTTTTTTAPKPAVTPAPQPVKIPALTTAGYELVGSDGGVFGLGNVPFVGSLPGLGVHVDDIKGIVPSSDDRGSLLVGADGGVFGLGDSNFEGSLPGLGIHVGDIVAIVPTADGGGYLLVGSDGGVFSFGDSRFLGSLPGIGDHVDDVVGIAEASGGTGYWVAEADGTVHAFGTAKSFGNVPNMGSPITAIVATPDGKGYWVLDAAGGVFNFGDAPALGSLATLGEAASARMISIVPTSTGKGYWLIGRDGSVFAFGDAPSHGSLPALGVRVHDVVAAAPVQSATFASREMFSRRR